MATHPKSDPAHLREAIDVMRDGGFQVCDYAIEKWLSGKYCLPPAEHVKRWEETRNLVAELCRSLREQVKSYESKLE